MKHYKYIFFDVAGTILHKPSLYKAIQKVLRKYRYDIPVDSIRAEHIALSEKITFPTKIPRQFYLSFNKQFLKSLRVTPDMHIIEDMYKNTYSLPWVPFFDTKVLSKLKTKAGIISNWDERLPELLKALFPISFSPIIYSHQYKSAKPDSTLFTLAIKESKQKPTDILYIGDSIHLDMKPAQSVGINTVLIDRYNIFPEYKKHKIASLEELMS